MASSAQDQLKNLHLRVEKLRQVNRFGVGHQIRGILVNESHATYKSITLSFELEDRHGNTQATVKANRRDELAPGNSWEFHVGIEDQPGGHRRVLVDVAAR